MLMEKIVEEMSVLTVDHYFAVLAVELLCHGLSKVIRYARKRLTQVKDNVDDVCADVWGVGIDLFRRPVAV